MDSSPFSRRDFVKATALAAAATQVPSTLRGASASAPANGPVGPVPLRWLNQTTPQLSVGTTWGVPWPRGRHAPETTFALETSAGEPVPVQSWPLAFWPDGSLKWTAHAVPADAGLADTLQLAPGQPAEAERALTVSETADSIEVDTGAIRCRMAKQGEALIASIVRDGREIARAGRLVCLLHDQPEPGTEGTLRQESFAGRIDAVTLEHSGPCRAVVKIEGKHANASGRAWLPFVVRLYFHAGAESIRVLHTIVFDGDESRDFIRGLGLRLTVPLRGDLHDRHVRFAGEGDGLWAEGVRNLTGLRRNPGDAVIAAQLAGEACPPVAEFPENVRSRLHLIPAYDDYTLVQPTPDSFEIRKRTKPGQSWLHASFGHRASGLGYIGTPSGGVAFGIRNFWQSNPTQLDVRGATTDHAEVTMWLWSPEVPAMDLRFYHDGMDMDDHAEQLEGLEITYEDYEPGFATPEGVARTSEMMIWAVAATPARARLTDFAGVVREPPMIVSTPEYYHAAGAFGGTWTPADRSTPARARIEDHLDWYFEFHRDQVDQRRWYGFWNFGDVMHSYDRDRHEWKYDVGGFAWDNSELSTDLWLWLYFLHSGRADAFRVAETMTRHTGEVDVHHLGRFAPLGSRHNVMHWGCSAKQLRISTATNRRYYYYLTADERVGDLMREQIEAVRTLVTIQPTRKLGRGPQRDPDPSADSAVVGFGTDWGSVAGAWLTEWERTGDAQMRTRLENGMRTIAAQPRGFFSSSSLMNFDTGEFQISNRGRAGASHLSAVFGLVEVCAELVQLIDQPEFEQAWLQYCRLFNAGGEEQERELGRSLGSLNLEQGHSRLSAYAAMRTDDAALARRAWEEFIRGRAGYRQRDTIASERIEGPAVLRPVEEAAWVSTNASAQWGLAAIQCLAFVPEALPEA